MRTYQAKAGSVERKWLLVDLDGKTLGRAATAIANVLRGKNKPQFTPHADTGDFVVAINADKVKLSGNKLDAKNYYRHTGWIGGLKKLTARELLEKHPTRVLRAAVKGMLPKNTLGRAQLGKLKIYAEDKHPHEAQQPTPMEL